MKRKKPSNFWLGAGSLVFATFLYSCWGIFSRIIGNSLALFYQNATRALLASIFIACIISIRKEWSKISKKDFQWIAIRSVFGVLGTAIFVHTVLYLSLGTFYFLFYGGSVIGGYMFGRIFLGDKITPIKIASLIVAGVGLALIFSVPTAAMNIKYLFYAFISGSCVALFNILSAKISSDNSPILITFWDSTISFPMFAGISLLLREAWIIPALNAVWGANLLFAATMIGTGSLIIYGFRRIDSHVGSLIMLTEILFAILFGYILYHEHLQLMTVVGGLLIIAAISLVHIKLKRV